MVATKLLKKKKINVQLDKYNSYFNYRIISNQYNYLLQRLLNICKSNNIYIYILFKCFKDSTLCNVFCVYFHDDQPIEMCTLEPESKL